MASWPSTLSLPKVPYEYQPEDALLRTDMESGPARARRRYTRVPTRYTLTCEFSREEMDVFEAWHKWELLDGQAWFTMPLANGRGVSVVDTRFVGPFTARLIQGGAFEAAFEVEVRARPVMTQAELAPSL